MSQANVDLIRRMYRLGDSMSLDDLLAALPELIPEYDDQPTGSSAVSAATGRTHDGDDLLDPRWVRWVAPSSVPG